MSGLYGAAALALATLGLYGLAARMVMDRKREIGIRIALGAAHRDVRRLVMTDAWVIVAMGVAVGAPLAFVASRLARGLAFGVTPGAPHVFGIGFACLMAAAVVATLVPVMRATRIDPAATLRDE